ncbi:vacuolar membrane protein-domain-containing protein [Zychaea mexicana]|uniref:vacuolar membrane protein-domain-containing protein n=1 Tax=Zychaea mexicana TaxID=64656 RepID=UPI0022FE7868|nr:vacuolar membrane protein-domain-containing protein [Zychaea mexicana]KAI9494548.1 vacuolar membrane protein-domain-containing protein [Zychaea mexicana]
MSRQSQTCSQGQTCELLDGFALLVQLTLVLTALAALGIKRWQERPRRPVQIWALDVSKQFIGAGTIHFLNLGISYLAGRPTNGRPATNLCVWYFLSLMVDTTIGIAILWFWLRILEWTLATFWNIRNLQHYGDPAHTSSTMLFRQWAKQTAVFVLAEFLMKICIYGMFQAFPAIFEIGDWVLQLIGTEDGHYQVVFVMFVFPLFMNAFQFCVIDTIIKGKHHHDDASSLLSSKTTKHHAPSKKNESTTFLHSIIVIDQQKQHPHERSPLLPSA